MSAIFHIKPVPLAPTLLGELSQSISRLAGSVSPPRTSHPVVQLNSFQQACDLFEADFASGTLPRIEEYLPWVPAADRPRLFEKLLQSELAHFFQDGTMPIRDQYLARFPQFAEIIHREWQRVSAPAWSCAHSGVVSDVTLMVTEGIYEGESFRFTRDQQVFLIGRSRSVHVRFRQDTRISRRHAQVEIGRRDVQLFDLDSENGTRVNGCRMKVACLSSGDVITLGKTSLTLQISYE